MYGDWRQWKRRTQRRWRKHGEGVVLGVCCHECCTSGSICGPCYAKQATWSGLLQDQLGGGRSRTASKEIIAESAAR